MQKLKKYGKRLLRLLGPLLFIFLVLRVVDPQATVRVLKEIRPDVALLSVLLFPVVNAALTIRWWFICRPLNIKVAFKKLFQIYYISWFLSALPFVGISPLAKLIYLKDANQPAGPTAVSIILDKLFDIIGLMAFGLFGLVYFPHQLFEDLQIWYYLGCLSLVVLVIGLFGGRMWQAFRTLLKRYANRRLQKLGHRFEEDMLEFWSGFNLASFALLLVISIAIGLLRSLVLYTLAIALGLDLSFGLIVACRALIGIVNVIPISISGLGTRDAILLMTLPVAGVSSEAAVALGFLAFLWTIGSKFVGVVFWLKRPLPPVSIMAMKDNIAP
jgi:uncharacterized protein (TIRG00374 family)